ncbi:MAG TPA: TonB-dependent receptor [Polyangiaceae bacterium]|nr:TonB-dependent receptor [Polyangiaceae bacterium]
MRTRALLPFVLATLVPAMSLVVHENVAEAAQGQGQLFGSIIDAATKKPLADVTVTVTSPAMQGAQTVITDASGSYAVPNLPPGQYSITCDLEGYKPYGRGGVTVNADSTIRLNVTLVPTTLRAEEVVVVDDAPSINVGSAATGRTIDKDFTSRVPVVRPGARGSQARSFESLADTAPGANQDTYGTSVSGTTSPENQFVIDGVSVNDPAYGILSTPLSIEFIDQVSVISGGYMPEYGRATGGVYDVVTKGGSNEFHGSVFTYLTPGVFEGHREQPRAAGNTISLDTSLVNINDFGFDFGGPIVKDKLWFYVGFDAAFTRYRIDRSLNKIRVDPNTLDQAVDEEGNGLVDPIPGTQTVRYATERAYQYIAKLTYGINADHNVSATVYGAPTFSGGGADFGIDQNSDLPENQILDMIGDTRHIRHAYTAAPNDLSLKYSGAFDNKNWLLDISFGWHHQVGGTHPSDGSELGATTGDASIPRVIFRRAIDFDGNPSPHPITDFEGLPDPSVCDAPAGSPLTTLCPVDNYNYGGPDYIDDAALNRYELRGVLTRRVAWLGHHVIKGGTDFELLTYDHAKAYSGGRRYREALDGSYFSDNREFGFLAGPDDPVVNNPQEASSLSFTAGAFVQDSWSIMDLVTLNAGVRVDGQYLFGDDGNLGLALNNEWSPRVGAIWDPTEKGKSKIFANFAIYYESVPLDLVDRSFPGERQIASLHDAATCDPRDPAQNNGACNAPGNRFPVGTPSDPNQTWIITGGDKVPVDPDISPQSTSEFVVGGEYELFTKGVVGVTYTRRWMNNVIEDMSRDEGQTYFIGNPGSGIASDFPEAERTYDAMSIYFEKKFDGADWFHWLASGSYTLSYLRGNWAGLFRPETTQLDPNVNSDFDLISLLPNRTGPLPGDSTHQIKVYGAVEFTPGKFIGDIGLAFKTQSGGPTNYLGSHELYGDSEVYILPRGAGERLPWVHRFDTHFGIGTRLSKASTLVFTMDIFNLFNFQEVTAVDDNYTYASVLPVKDGTPGDLKSKLTHPDGSPVEDAELNKNFGHPTSYQAPRQFRFGVKATF